MNAAFIAAVVDTLLPGDSGGPAGEPPLPKASAAGLNLGALQKAHITVFEAIVTYAGSADAFITADEPARSAAAKHVEHATPDAFRAMLSALLADYYECASVLFAMGWRSEPPQPSGHRLKSSEGATEQYLERVRGRNKLWRE